MASRRETHQFIKEWLWVRRRQGVGEPVRSLDKYLFHIKDTAYLPVHLKVGTITKEELLEGVVLEIGAGVGNDVEYLLKSIGVRPQNLFLTEPDIITAVDAMDKLEPICGGLWLEHNFFHESILDPNLLRFFSRLADVVYMNNALHSIGSLPSMAEDRETRNMAGEQRVREAVRAVHKLLVPEGIFFGRTLSGEINAEKLKRLMKKANRTEQENFALKTALALINGELTGVSDKDLRRFALSDAGFTRGWVKPSPQVADWSPTIDIYFRFEK